MTRRAILIAAIACGCAGLRITSVDDPSIARFVPQIARGDSWRHVALTPDERFAFIGDDDGAIAVWGLDQRVLLRTMTVHRARIIAVAASDRSGYSIADDGSLCETDLHTLTLRMCSYLTSGLETVIARVIAAEFSPDRGAAALLVESRGGERSVTLVDVRHWAIIDTRLVGWFFPVAIAWSPDGASFAVAGKEGVVGHTIGDEFVVRLPAKAAGVAWTTRGIVVVREDYALELYDPATKARVWRTPVTAWAGAVKPDPFSTPHLTATRADRVIVEFNDGDSSSLHATIVELIGGASVSPITAGSDGDLVNAIGVSPSGVTAIALGSAIAMWDLARGALVKAVSMQRAGASAVAYARNGIWIGGLGTISRFDPRAATFSTYDIDGTIRAISSDGQFAIVERDGRFSLWAIGDLHPVPVRALNGLAMFACKLTGPGCKLVTAASIADAASGDHLHSFWTSPSSVAAVSADARRVATARQHVREHHERASRDLFEPAPIDEHAVDIINTTNGGVIGTIALRDKPSAIALSDDGQRVAVVETWSLSTDKRYWPGPKQRLHVFDTTTGAEVATPEIETRDITALTFAHNRRFLIGANACVDVDCRRTSNVWILDLARGETRRLGRHDGYVSSIAVSPDGAYAMTLGSGTVKIWHLDDGFSVTAIVADGNWIMYDDSSVFDGSLRGAGLVAAVKGQRAFPLEQFAAVNNRPDLLLTRMRFGRDDVIAYFRSRYFARAAKLAIPAAKPTRVFDDGPAIELERFAVDGKFVDLAATLTSVGTNLDRYQIWINQVPVVPDSDTKLTGTHVHIERRVELTPGDNRIEISARSTAGIESLRTTQTARYDAVEAGRLYFVALGVSNYRTSTLERLPMAARDAVDLTRVFERLAGGDVHPALIDRDVTPNSIEAISAYFSTATVDDTVVMLVSGHGALSDAGEFLFVPYAFDPADPDGTAIKLSALMRVLGNTKARKRVLLIDSCVSGERDEVEVGDLERLARAANLRSRLAKDIGIRPDVGGGARNKRGLLRLPREYLLDRDRLIFDDDVRGNGIVVFSSSRWNEASYESDAWGHGAFTAELIRVLSTGERISLDQLVREVRNGVAQRTQGFQHPTLSQDNRDAAISFAPLDRARPR